MSEYVIVTPPIVDIPVAGTDALFPVRRVYCIGRTYTAHAVEMDHDPEREPPIFLQKTPKKKFGPSREFPYPLHSIDAQLETAMLVALKSGSANILLDQAVYNVFDDGHRRSGQHGGQGCLIDH